jgi:hypothetical protein
MRRLHAVKTMPNRQRIGRDGRVALLHRPSALAVKRISGLSGAQIALTCAAVLKFALALKFTLPITVDYAVFFPFVWVCKHNANRVFAGVPYGKII